MAIFSSRNTGALAIVALAALAVPVIGDLAEAGLVVLVLGIGAVLLAADAGTAAAAPVRGVGEGGDEGRLVMLLDAVDEPLLILEDGRVERANAAARALLGEAMTGYDIRLGLRHPDATDHLSTLPPGPSEIDLEGLAGAGRHWRMRVSGLDGDRRVVHLADRSAQRDAERMRVDFVANASHELKTPLAGILGFVETLSDAEAGADAATRSRFLEIIAGEARRMVRLIDDLLSLSRIDADRYRRPLGTIDLLGLAREAAEVAADELGAGDRLDIAGDPAAVAGDPVQLAQLVRNLVANALRYGRPGTPVRVRVEREGAATLLLVQDEGEGIAPVHLPRLTERFYRVDPGRSRGLGGTGLGLAIVKHVAERHRARLDIASTPGEGTCVTVRFPSAGEAPS